jgi:hypothetical protein
LARSISRPFTLVSLLGHLRLGVQALLGVNAFAGWRLHLDFTEGRLYLLS